MAPIDIKPMDENYLHLVCLHDGPVDTTTVEPPPEQGPGGHPPHPWSDETLREVADRYRTEKVYHPRPADFMLEMIHRYGTCAMLAWEGRQVVGHLRFYPMGIARLFVPPQDDISPKAVSWACEPEDDDGTLWVQCVMTARPYLTSTSFPTLASAQTSGDDADVVTTASGHRHYRTDEEAGARRGIGLKLVEGFIAWAREHRWKRIVHVAHADVDMFYGQLGGGGKAFWEKAGFKAVKSYYCRPDNWESSFMDLVEMQADEKGMTPKEVWTWYRMRCDI